MADDVEVAGPAQGLAADRVASFRRNADALVAALTSPPTDGGQPILAQAATAEVAHLPGRAIDRILAISVDAAGGETVTVSGILRRTRISYIGACRLSATLTDPADGTVLGAGSGFAGAQVDYRPGKDSGDGASWLGFTSGSTSGSISGIATPSA